MGAVESTNGFYNERKIIQYTDGTVAYPGLTEVPAYQVREWQEAEARRQNVKRRQEKLFTLDGSDEENLSVSEEEKEEEIIPDNIPFDRVALAHHAFATEQEKKRLNKFGRKGRVGSTSGHSSGSQKKSDDGHNQQFEMERLVDDMDLSSLSESSIFERESFKGRSSKNGRSRDESPDSLRCPGIDCGVISKLKNYRKSRKIYGDEEMDQLNLQQQGDF